MKNDDPITLDFYHDDEPREWKSGRVKEYCDRNVPGLLEEMERRIMMNYYRNKYQKYPDRNYVMKHKPGGEDVNRLCDTVRALEEIIKWVMPKLSTDERDEVSRRLFWAMANLKDGE